MAVVSGLERYRYISPLGSGGMATVSLAEDVLLGRKVALKRLSGSRSGDAGGLLAADRDKHGITRLKREALLGASVSHPNLVSIYDAIATEDGDLVVVMEYVPGETLSDRLSREGRLSPQAALPVLAGVAAGLDAIHELGIVHRDVKPANVLLGTEGTVKLADLGIASVPDRTRITSAGSVLGTFRYMAPEQLEDGPSTPAVDVYALGCVAFEMLSGLKARPESNPMALAHAIATQPPPNLSDAWPDAPPAVAAVLAQAMERDPSRRPQRAGDLAARLRAALEPEPTAPVVPAAPPAAAEAAGAAAGAAAASAPRRATPKPIGRRPGAAATLTPPRTPNRARRLVPALLVAVAAAAVVAVVLATTGGGTGSASATHRGAPRGATASASTRSRSHRHTRGHRAAASATTGSAGSAGTASSPSSTSPAVASSTSGSSAPATTGAGTPVSAVESFYHLAAAHQYTQAWALADPTFRSQLRGYSSFAAGQAADRSITFDSARVLSQTPSAASVAVQTTSVRQNGTQHCTGSVDLVPAAAGGSWLLHQIHITCS